MYDKLRLIFNIFKIIVKKMIIIIDFSELKRIFICLTLNTTLILGIENKSKIVETMNIFYDIILI